MHKRLMTYLLVLLVGAALGAGTTAYGARRDQKVNIQQQILLNTQQILGRIGRPYDSSDMSVNGMLARINRNSDSQYAKLQAICQATSARC